MRISDWSSDVCSSDLGERGVHHARLAGVDRDRRARGAQALDDGDDAVDLIAFPDGFGAGACRFAAHVEQCGARRGHVDPGRGRSEEHTSELQSLMRISYAVFCLKKKNYNRSE